MTWDRIERLIGTDNLARLAAKRVAVIGLGSGGGFVAQTLAMSGVGGFVLIDDDDLEAPNIVRHVADARHIGARKVDAVADLIRQRNPAARVTALYGRIEAHFDAIADVDLLLVCIDGEGVKYRINEVARAQRLTAVYAGVYERGEGGDVVILRPDDADSPCYACWAAHLRDDLPVSDDNASLDYGMINESGTLEAEPGLWLHVVRVATAQAEIALNELLIGTSVHRPLPGSTVVLANTALEIMTGVVTPPMSALWVTIARDPDCLVCGGRTSRVSLDELTAASGIIDDALDAEDAPAD